MGTSLLLLPHPLPSRRSTSGLVPSSQPELRAGWRGGDKASQVAPRAQGGEVRGVRELSLFLLETSGVLCIFPNKATVTQI